MANNLFLTGQNIPNINRKKKNINNLPSLRRFSVSPSVPTIQNVNSTPAIIRKPKSTIQPLLGSARPGPVGPRLESGAFTSTRLPIAGVRPTIPKAPTEPITAPVDTRKPDPTTPVDTVREPDPVIPEIPSAEDEKAQRIVEERLRGIDTTKTPPVTPEIEANKAVAEAEKVLAESLKISPEELSTRADIDRLIESTKKAFQNTSDQPIPLPFITGQLKSIERRALGLAEPLERKLARLQAKRTSAIEASKFALERADKEAGRERTTAEKLKIDTKTQRNNVLEIAADVLNAGGTQEQVKQVSQAKSVEEALSIATGTGLFRERLDDAGFTLSPGQKRFETDPITGEVREVARGGEKELSPEAQLKVKEKAETKTRAQKRSLDQSNVALTSIDQVLNNPAFNANPINRVIQSKIPGTDDFDFAQSIITIKSLIGFNALEKMRLASPTGGALGQVSERELEFLQSVAGSINIGQKNETLKTNIARIKLSFERLKAINDPTTTPEEFLRVFPEATDQELEEIIQKNEQISFNGVGGDTNQALNRPQRNNNPGNIKSGGLADNLAIGQDEQGHLIFPDAETGFEALKADLEAKISGNSRVIKANPTIAELGAVFAEDPNWANGVASILGIKTSTKTSTIDINKLVSAIVRQEGFI